MSHKNRTNWPLRIAVTAICLVLLTTFMVLDMFARYVANDGNANSARVAKFNITASTELGRNANFITNRDGIQYVYVENKSEVAVNCSYTLTFPEALPSDCTFWVKIGSDILPSSSNGLTWTWSDSLAAGQTKTYILVFVVKDANQEGTSGTVHDVRDSLYDVKLQINATQID